MTARSILIRAAREGRLGSLAPFVHPIISRLQPMKLTQKPTQQVTAQVKTVVNPQLDQKAQEYQIAAAKAAQAEARKKALGKEIAAIILDQVGEHGSLITDDYKVTHVPGSNSYLDEQKLIAAGVSLRTIRRCKVTTTYSYPRITRTGLSKADEDADSDLSRPKRAGKRK